MRLPFIKIINLFVYFQMKCNQSLNKMYNVLDLKYTTLLIINYPFAEKCNFFYK